MKKSYKKNGLHLIVVVIIIAVSLSFVYIQSHPSKESEDKNVQADSKEGSVGSLSVDSKELVNLIKNDKEVGAALFEFVKSNPEAIIASLQEREKRERDKLSDAANKKIKESQNAIYNDPKDPYIGNKDGKKIVVEFFDYSCGYCRQSLPILLKLIEEDKDVKVIFKEYPILSPVSEVAARWSLSVFKLNPEKFMEFHKKMVETRISGEATIFSVAESLGIDVKKIQEIVNTEEINQIIANSRNLAQSLGVSGTPAFIMNDKLYPGFIESHEVFKQELNNKK